MDRHSRRTGKRLQKALREAAVQEVRCGPTKRSSRLQDGKRLRATQHGADAVQLQRAGVVAPRRWISVVTGAVRTFLTGAT